MQLHWLYYLNIENAQMHKCDISFSQRKFKYSIESDSKRYMEMLESYMVDEYQIVKKINYDIAELDRGFNDAYRLHVAGSKMA